jgi:hypothetical protein
VATLIAHPPVNPGWLLVQPVPNGLLWPQDQGAERIVDQRLPSLVCLLAEYCRRHESPRNNTWVSVPGTESPMRQEEGHPVRFDHMCLELLCRRARLEGLLEETPQLCRSPGRFPWFCNDDGCLLVQAKHRLEVTFIEGLIQQFNRVFGTICDHSLHG